jgi:hypothetical protein
MPYHSSPTYLPSLDTMLGRPSTPKEENKADQNQEDASKLSINDLHRMCDEEVLLCGYQLFFFGELKVEQLKNAIKSLSPKIKNLPTTRLELQKVLRKLAQQLPQAIPDDLPLTLDEIEIMAQCDVIRFGRKVFTMRTVPAAAMSGICWVLNLDSVGDERFEKIYLELRGKPMGSFRAGVVGKATELRRASRRRATIGLAKSNQIIYQVKSTTISKAF